MVRASDAGLAPCGTVLAYPARYPEQQQGSQDDDADHCPKDVSGNRCLPGRCGEADLVRGVAGRVDLAGGVERGQQLRAGARLVGPEVFRVPEPGQDDLMPVGQVRQQLLRGVLGRRLEVERPADEQRRDVRVLHAGVLVLTRVGRPVGKASCPPQELREGIADDRAPVRAGAEIARGGLRVGQSRCWQTRPRRTTWGG